KTKVWRNEFLASGHGLEVSPDGKRVAHVSTYAVTVFDTETGKQMLRVRDELYTAAQFSSDSRTLALTSSFGTVILHDVATAKRLPQSPDLSGAISGLTFSDDGRQLAAAAGDGYDQQWIRWDLSAAVPDARPTPLAKFTVLAPNGRVGVRPDTFSRDDLP